MPEPPAERVQQKPATPQHAIPSVNTRRNTSGPKLDCQRMTATIAIRPSPAIGSFPESDIFKLNQPASPTSPTSQAQKPRLSLNTRCAQRTVGRTNTGLRLDTLSAVSPTQQNTYKNTYEPPAAPSTPFCAVNQTLSPGTLGSPQPSSPHSQNQSENSSTSSNSPAPSPTSSSSSAATREVPYSIHTSLHSILSNSPLPKAGNTQMDAQDRRKSSSASTGSTGRRVCFRQPQLAEEIKTVKYTVPHLDLLQPKIRSPTVHQEDSLRNEARTGDKRDSPSDDDDDDLDNGRGGADDCDTYPKTPVAGRKKKRREWLWTLGPMPGANMNSGGGLRTGRLDGDDDNSPTHRCN